VFKARLDEEIALTKVTQARAQALPGLSLDGSYTRLDEIQKITVGDDTFEAGTLDNYALSAELSQTLYSGGQVRAALRAARLTETWADRELKDAEALLKKTIRSQFLGVLLAKASIAVREESVKQLEALLEVTREKLKQGKASEFDMLRAQVSLANERPKLVSEINTHDLAVETFRRLLNLGDAPFELQGTLSAEPLDADLVEFQKLALQNRASVAAMDALVGLREQDLEAAKAGTRPSVSAFASYNGANSYGFVSFEDEWQWHWNAGVSLSWDLWDGGLTRGTVREKEAELAKSLRDSEEIRRSAKLDVRQAALRMQHARELVESEQGSVELAEKALDIAGARRDAGLSTHLEYTDANLALSTARLTHLRALHGHSVAIAELEYACGVSGTELRKR